MKSSREVKEAATLAERERIIKLLEDEMLSDDDTAWQTRDWQEVERQQDQDWVIKEAIALIKGENMAAIRADRNSDIAQQEYADFSNPLIKGEQDCSCRPEGQCLYHKYLADGGNK